MEDLFGSKKSGYCPSSNRIKSQFPKHCNIFWTDEPTNEQIDLYYLLVADKNMEVMECPDRALGAAPFFKNFY